MSIYTPITAARFWSKVDVGENDQCWPWLGAKGRGRNGAYGNFRIPGTRRCVSAHRLAWELYCNEPLGPRHACHHCDNPECCNPHHIYAGDQESNTADAVSRGLLKTSDQRGASNGNAKLSDTDVQVILGRIEAGETNVEIAKDYPVSHSMISKIRTGEGWRSRQDSNLLPLASEASALSR